MRKNLTRALSLLMAAVMVMSLMVVPASAAPTVANVGALWDGFTSGSGTFTVTKDSRLFVKSDSAPTGNLLQTVQLIQRELRDEFEGAFDELVYGDVSLAKTGDIVIALDSSSGTGADGYKLNVTDTTATITAADTDGLIYGANNLMKCFRAVGGNSISCFSGNDTPDTKERTVHLDLARKYYTAEWVKNFIRQMSWMGYNALELHLSEDGGFRADFWEPTYYKGSFQPENDFSWLCGSQVQYWVHGSYVNDPNKNAYLKTAELVDICNVAKEYHIEIIPSFDSPAHMDYITWKFEQNYKSNKSYSFKYDGTTYNASSTEGCINYANKRGAASPNGYYTTIDITQGTMARAFVFALYEDMADFFKEYAGSTKFNIGADEVGLGRSATWGYEQFPEYINSLNRMLNAKDYTVRMYNDFIGSKSYNQLVNGKAKYGSDAEGGFDSNIEICYWHSDFDPTNGGWSEDPWHVKFFWENNNGTSDNWGDGGRTMYNCIQTNTYYVLRVAADSTAYPGWDARHPENYNWTFYGTNEEDIYNDWYPADISEKGIYTEDAADVPDAQLGGAYFLIWNDYAAVNTESEVWNGANDKKFGSSKVYYLFDIMASNIQKMWNSDINGTVSYSKFAEVREATLEWFPGFEGCSAAASLPAATEPARAVAPADKTALQNAVNSAAKKGADAYTPASYVAYEEAFAAAVAAAQNVLNNGNASQDDVNAAVTKLAADLTAAEAKLVLKADKNALQAAMKDKITNDNGTYTVESYQAYEEAYAAAVAAAKAVLNDANASQAQVDAAAKTLTEALAAAEDKLVEKSQEDVGTAELKVELLARTFRKGKKVALRITTDASATSVTVDGQTLSLCVASEKAQTLKDGSQVKIWLVEFPATVSGAYTVTATGNGQTWTNDNVLIEVK